MADRPARAGAYHGRVPASALHLLAFFTFAALVIGALAAWVVGPRRWWAVIVPAGSAFLALWAIGHRSGMAVGPTVILFGFEVNLLFDLGAATLAAAIAALAQCLVVSRLRGARTG